MNECALFAPAGWSYRKSGQLSVQEFGQVVTVGLPYRCGQPAAWNPSWVWHRIDCSWLRCRIPLGAVPESPGCGAGVNWVRCRIPLGAVA